MIGKVIVGPRDVIVACKLINGTVIADSAVDVAASNLDEYEQSLYNRKHLTLKPGVEPTLFKIKPLTCEQKETADSFESYRGKAKWYWRCGVKAIKNYVIQDDAGLVQMTPQPDGDATKPASAEWFERIDPPEQYLIAVYKMIAQISEADLPLSSSSVTPAGQQLSEKTAPTE